MCSCPNAGAIESLGVHIFLCIRNEFPFDHQQSTANPPAHLQIADHMVLNDTSWGAAAALAGSTFAH